MRKIVLTLGILIGSNVVATERPKAVVIPHAGIQSFEHRGNKIQGLSTKSKGAKEFEVWHASIAANSSTPPNHSHETEEVFIFLKGKGKAIVGGVETLFEAPCTVILPARVAHQVINVGEEATDHFVIIGAGSKIFGQDGVEMQLPWR